MMDVRVEPQQGPPRGCCCEPSARCGRNVTSTLRSWSSTTDSSDGTTEAVSAPADLVGLPPPPAEYAAAHYHRLGQHMLPGIEQRSLTVSGLAPTRKAVSPTKPDRTLTGCRLWFHQPIRFGP